MANFNVTIPKAQVSPAKQPNPLGWTHKFKIKYTDIAVSTATGATDTITVSLGSTPNVAWAAPRAFAVLNTAFAGTTALTVQVGTTTTTTALIAATSVLSGSHIVPSGGFNAVNTVASAYGTTGTGLVAIFTNATGGSPSALTAGEVDIYLTLVESSKLDGNPF